MKSPLTLALSPEYGGEGIGGKSAGEDARTSGGGLLAIAAALRGEMQRGDAEGRRQTEKSEELIARVRTPAELAPWVSHPTVDEVLFPEVNK